jgi:hypothetical protein
VKVTRLPNILFFLILGIITMSGQGVYAKNIGMNSGNGNRIEVAQTSVFITPILTTPQHSPDSAHHTTDSIPVSSADSIIIQTDAQQDSAIVLYADSIQRSIEDTLNLDRFNNWKPDPIRAMWLALVVPGGGQIYNRKYWKLPIVYGGVVGCIYALGWNSQMLRDYSQAYQDITDTDPTTNSHMEMLPLGYNITGREEHFKSVFLRKKSTYRRYRDLSIFCIAGVYLLSIVDAFVDAELSTFDIGTDLSLTVSPQMIPSGPSCAPSTIGSSPGISVNLQY